MLSPEAIKENNRAEAIKASQAGEVPFLVEEGDVESMPPFPFPNIGDYRPEGWELVEQYFCDKTGLDNEGPALSVSDLLETLKVGMGYAIIEEGQFQLYVGEFKRAEEVVNNASHN